MKSSLIAAAFAVASSSMLIDQPAIADVIIPYNEYSNSPTIGHGAGTSTDPKNPGYGAMRIFIQKVADYTSALPSGQKVIFQRNQSTGREVNALRAGIQFANTSAASKPAFSEPSWGFIYNSVPFGMNFEQTLEFLYDAKVDASGRNGLELAQALLDNRGGTQIVFPVVGSTMQGSGYFPQPIGKPACNAGDVDCQSQGNGIGLAGFCTSGWRIRYLAPPQDVVDRACDILVERGVIRAKTLKFYPPVGGQSVLLPMQRGTIQGFEYVNPNDDLLDFFPVKEATANRPLGNPDAGNLDCGPAIAFPIPAGTQPSCTQNIGQIGARFAHHPSWHQPFLLSWMHVDKTVWNGLNAAQTAAVLKAAKDSVVESYNAAESVECKKLKDMIDINDGIAQRNPDGTPRLSAGKSLDAKITMAIWPDDALKVLREATTDYMASLDGSKGSGEKTDVQKDFAVISTAWMQYAKSVGAADTFTPGQFPAKTGLAAGETCNLVK